MKENYIQYLINHPYRILSLAFLLTTVFIYGIKWLVFDDDFVSLLPENIKSREVWMDISDEFGESEVFIIGVGNKDESIYNATLLNKIYRLSEQLEQHSLVDEVISISTFDKITSDDGFMEVSDLMESDTPSAKQINEIKEYLNDNHTISSRINSENGNYTSIIIRPNKGVNNATLLKDIIPLSNSILNGYEIYYSGQSYITGIIPELISNDVKKLMIIGIIIMIIVLLLNLRSVYGVFLIMITIIFSMLSMLGFMGWMFHITGYKYFNFTMMNTSMPIVLLTIANSDGVHMLSRFFKEMRRKRNTKEAISSTLNSLSLPIFLTSFTTSIAFLTMFLSPIKHMSGYGVSMAFGISWAWILSVTLIPSLLLIKNWNLNIKSINSESILEKFVYRIKQTIQNSPKQVLSSGLIIVLISIVGLFYITVEVNTNNFFKPGHPIRDSAEFIDSKLMGSMNLLVKANGDIKSPQVLNQLDSLQSYLINIDKINASVSIVDIIKQMHQAVMDDNPNYNIIPNQKEKVNNLFTMYSMTGDPDDFSSLIDYEYKSALITSMMQSISTSETVELVANVEEWIDTNISEKIDLEISGLAVFFRDFVDLVIKSSIISILSSILIIFLIAWYYFKYHIMGLLAIIPLSSAVLINFGLMGLFGIELSHITALLTSVIIGVGVDFAIHYLSELKRNSNKLNDISLVNDKTIDDVGYPIILDVISNLGFSALFFSAVVPLNYMGGLMVFAMFSTSIATLTLMASIIEINKNKILKGLR